MQNAIVAAAMLAAGAAASAQPDLIVARMNSVSHWTSGGAVDGKRAYSFSIDTCNIGDDVAMWRFSNGLHPVFAQNILRIRDGALEQIGLGFGSHGFFALQQNFCGSCTPPAVPDVLGVGCSNSDTANIMGQQSLLGPRSGVNASTGALVFPLPADQCAGSICERPQAAEADLADPDAIYIAQTVVVHFEDAAAGNTANNSATRQLMINPSTLGGLFAGDTMVASAVQTWREIGDGGEEDEAVIVSATMIPNDGVVLVGSRATYLGDGVWKYVYAIENLSSDRSVAGLSVIMGQDLNPQNISFHDVDYHSGEIYDGADWTGFPGAASIIWFMPTPQNPNGNAIRWGTTYTFSFESRARPRTGPVLVSLFKPGTPSAFGPEAVVPGSIFCEGDVSGNGVVDFEDLNQLLDAYGDTGPYLNADFDVDGDVDFGDLNLLLDRYGQDC